MPHIEEPEFVNRSSFLGDEEYGKVLDNIVVCCADCIVTHNGHALLGRRWDEPCKDQWWIMGGRMKIGEQPEQTVQRLLKREVNLVIEDLSRIIELSLPISYVWKKRAQLPKTHGCHMVGLYYAVSVSDDEKALLDTQKSNDNFSEFKWKPVVDMRADDSLHKGMRILADKLYASFPDLCVVH